MSVFNFEMKTTQFKKKNSTFKSMKEDGGVEKIELVMKYISKKISINFANH